MAGEPTNNEDEQTSENNEMYPENFELTLEQKAIEVGIVQSNDFITPDREKLLKIKNSFVKGIQGLKSQSPLLETLEINFGKFIRKELKNKSVYSQIETLFELGRDKLDEAQLVQFLLGEWVLDRIINGNSIIANPT